MEGCLGGVTVITDHQPLTLLMQQHVLSRVQTRWIRLGFFQSIQPTIRYQPGEANILADALSRSRREEFIGSESSSTTGNLAPEIAVITRSSIVLTEEIQLWKEAQTKDPTTQTTMQQLKKQPKREPRYAQTPQE